LHAHENENGNADDADASQRGLTQITFLVFPFIGVYQRFIGYLAD